MQVDDTSTAALAATRQSHANLAQSAGVGNDVSLLRVPQKLFLKLGICCIVHQTGDELGEQRHLNKNHQATILQSNINASLNICVPCQQNSRANSYGPNHLAQPTLSAVKDYFANSPVHDPLPEQDEKADCADRIKPREDPAELGILRRHAFGLAQSRYPLDASLRNDLIDPVALRALGPFVLLESLLVFAAIEQAGVARVAETA